jgi:predicted dehydrogenase
MTLIHEIDLAQWITGSDFRAATTAGVICDLRTAWTFKVGAKLADRLEVVGDRGSVGGRARQHMSVATGNAWKFRLWRRSIL